MLTFFFLTTFLFAALATYFAFRYDRKIRENAANEKEISRRVFELSLLSDITEKVGYSLNIESVAATISLAVEKLFDLTTVSYAIKNNKTVNIKTYLKESVNISYTQSVSKIIVDAMTAIDPKFSSYQVVEEPSKSLSESYSSIPIDGVVKSYFNIPLVIDNELVGMLNISSRKKGVYQESDMSLLYKLVNTAQTTIAKLHSVIETEKGKLDSMILSLPSGAILFGFEKGSFNLSVINNAAKTFLGLAEGNIDIATVISKFPNEIKLVEQIKSVITDRKSVILKDVRVHDKTFRIFITPVFAHSTGSIVGVSLTMRDMTIEEQIEKIRRDFTNMIVHDLRAPAAAIRGASSILSSGNLSDDDREKMMRVIADSSNNMLVRISDILDVAKLSEGSLKIRKNRADFVEFMKQHVDVFSYAAREKNIDISFEVENDVPEFMFDNERVGQVVNNLISNSLKFTDHGGKIYVKIRRKDSDIEVMIQDTGIGIPFNQKAALFTKFGRIRQHGVASGQSTGLGLYISKQIVEAHGGKIWVESPVSGLSGQEKGTAFYFTLPYEVEEKHEAVSRQEFAN